MKATVCDLCGGNTQGGYEVLDVCQTCQRAAHYIRDRKAPQSVPAQPLVDLTAEEAQQEDRIAELRRFVTTALERLCVVCDVWVGPKMLRPDEQGRFYPAHPVVARLDAYREVCFTVDYALGTSEADAAGVSERFQKALKP